MTLRDQIGRTNRRGDALGRAVDTQVIDVRTAPSIPVGVGLPHVLSVEQRAPLRAMPDDDPPAGTWSGPLVRLGVRPLIVLVDVIACAVGALVTSGVRPVMFLFTALMLGVFALGGLYRSRLAPSILDDLPKISGRILVALALTMSAQLTLNELRWDYELVDWKLLLATAVAFSVGVCGRSAAYSLVRHARRTGRIAHRTLILGAGRVGTYLAGSLSTHPEYGLLPIGFLDIEPPRESVGPVHRVLGRPEELVEVLLDHQVRNVVVAFGSMPESEMVGIIRTCDRLHCEIFVVPRLFELQHIADDMDTAWGMPLIRLRRAAYRTRAWQVKRAVDIFVSAFSVLLLSPLMLLVALAVRLEGGPGVLFRQERVGVDGRHFELLKFRSMKPVDAGESATNWSIVGDHRLGPVGRFLRRSSLDELPQLLNILRGDMSLVGPRPERPHFVATFRRQHPHYVARHRVPCGLTGLAQVNGLRGDTSIAERARFDNYYIENWSLWLDVKILLRTAMSVVRGEGG